jgi:hypothetical protein
LIFGEVGSSISGYAAQASGGQALSIPLQAFSTVADTVGSGTVSNVQQRLMARNPGNLVLELTTGRDVGSANVTILTPMTQECPTGTTEVADTTNPYKVP